MLPLRPGLSIEAVVLVADALRRADLGSAATTAPIGWFDLQAMWASDLIDLEIVAVLEHVGHLDQRPDQHLTVTAIIREAGRTYLVETSDWVDNRLPSTSSLMSAD